ncbi:hypothetical protein EDD18DRAFT_1068941 [Armillaria luteobubalina]|uniref:Reverse transcriptase domain-containing protein n=1 Tax=Armillaria luteobubalina TaxID=153913 RepID=A0AA39QCC5_9AGAR|nr:hypothetical protein EDD18DRAFT_1068941 [Armillaria luteobubalina]
MPLHVVKDSHVKGFILRAGHELQESIEKCVQSEHRTSDENPQKLWEVFTEKLCELARQRAKATVPNIDKEIHQLKAEITAAENSANLGDESSKTNLMILHERLDKITQLRHRKRREVVQARNILEGEVISKYWSNINKPLKPRDTIQRLKKPGQRTDQGTETRYTTDSQEMANIGRDYHDQLQGLRWPVSIAERTDRIKAAMECIKSEVPPDLLRIFEDLLSREDVQEALELSANNKAPGLNGIPYEVFKIINSWYEESLKDGEPGFDIITVLQLVFNDIERHGLRPGSRFAKSWMCPLYKKNDKTEISNYRPISLLNSDYKIMTKALAIKLA